jgi:hypothetical protein
MDPEKICNRLGLVASRMWTAGSQRRTPTGTPLDGVNAESYCSFRLEPPDEVGLVDFLKNFSAGLYRHKDFFEEIRSTGGRLEYFIGLFLDVNSGVVFDFDLHSKLAELKIDLSLDLYCESKEERNKVNAGAIV